MLTRWLWLATWWVPWLVRWLLVEEVVWVHSWHCRDRGVITNKGKVEMVGLMPVQTEE